MSPLELELRAGFNTLAARLERHLEQVRKRGRSSRTDALGGLAIEPGDAEGLLAELSRNEAIDSERYDSMSQGISTFSHARRCFDLTLLECDVLLIALAPELDARFCRLFGFLNDSVVAFRPTIGLAMAILGEGPHALSRFLPDARLLQLGLLQLDGDAPLSGRSMRIAPDIWPRLSGLQTERLTTATPGVAANAEQAVGAIRAGERPLVIVTGPEATETIASLSVALRAVEIREPLESERWRAAGREALWRAVPIAIRGSSNIDLLVTLARNVDVPLIVHLDSGQLAEVARDATRQLIEIETHSLDDLGRAEIWTSLGADRIEVDVAEISHRFRFTAEQISGAMQLARSRAAARGETEASAIDIRTACRSVGGAGASRLAQRVAGSAHHEDLVLPNSTRVEIEMLETAARHGHALFRPGARGDAVGGVAGSRALFAGPPGTGKTTAAHLVARRLEVELLRIDLSQVVNKYIGETEKHLETVFREAESSGALLFFDEADALFGKRTGVKDAHDRYANLETAFLLQRLEQHPGVTILATNLLQNIDAAFLRRLQFIIQFPLPSREDRSLIWERHLVREFLDQEVDLRVLAEFELSGGDIRNAVVSAVLQSANEQCINMRHLLIGVARELRKSGRLAQPEQFGKWSNFVSSYLRP